jgi:hypothetical protein
MQQEIPQVAAVVGGSGVFSGAFGRHGLLVVQFQCCRIGESSDDAGGSVRRPPGSIDAGTNILYLAASWHPATPGS